MTIEDRTSGEKSLETIVDFDHDKFAPIWDMVAHKLMNLSIDKTPRGLYADAFDMPTDIILRCAIEVSAIEAFSATDMAGLEWYWDFCCDSLPVGQARLYASEDAKIRIRSTAHWQVFKFKNGVNQLHVKIGDFKVSPIEE